MYIGQVDSSGRRYMRCVACGDSQKDSRHAHGFIDINGVRSCWRCGVQIRLSVSQYLAVAMGWADVDEVTDEDWTPYPRRLKVATLQRKTLLTPYLDEGDPLADSFGMYDKHGRLIGWHTRRPNSRNFHNEGQRGLGWYLSDEGKPLISTATNPITLVEGAYDCIDPNYVSAFGSIGKNTFKHVKGQYVIVYPDPDVINTADKRKKFVDMLLMANDNYAWVQGIISANDDPDKATKKLYIPLSKAVERVRYESA